MIPHLNPMMTKPPAPKKDETLATLSTRIPEDQKEALESIATRYHVNNSTVARWAIDVFLSRLKSGVTIDDLLKKEG